MGEQSEREKKQVIRMQKEQRDVSGENANKQSGEKPDLYADIRNLPRHVSNVHPQMPRANRAAQFMPFSALNGYGEAVQETARQTEVFRELDEDSRSQLDEKLQIVQQKIRKYGKVSVVITCFVADPYKEGGSYQNYSGLVKRVDVYRRRILLMDGAILPMEYITDIEIPEEE